MPAMARSLVLACGGSPSNDQSRGEMPHLAKGEDDPLLLAQDVRDRAMESASRKRGTLDDFMATKDHFATT